MMKKSARLRCSIDLLINKVYLYWLKILSFKTNHMETFLTVGLERGLARNFCLKWNERMLFKFS